MGAIFVFQTEAIKAHSSPIHCVNEETLLALLLALVCVVPIDWVLACEARTGTGTGTSDVTLITVPVVLIVGV